MKKLRVALHLRNSDIVHILGLVDFKATESELTAFFRSEDHEKYRPMGDQMLRNFLNGLVIHMRGPMDPKEAAKKDEKPASKKKPAPSFKSKPKTEGKAPYKGKKDFGSRSSAKGPTKMHFSSSSLKRSKPDSDKKKGQS